MNETLKYNIGDKITIEGYGYDEKDDLCLDGRKYHKKGKAKGNVEPVVLTITRLSEGDCLPCFISPPKVKGDL